MKIPEVPFQLQFEHNGSRLVAPCVDVQPAGDVSPGAFRFCVQTRRTFGMLPDEHIWLISERGDRRAATREHQECSLSGDNTVTLVAIIPCDWFD